MSRYSEPLTPRSLPTPTGRANNFWYVRNDSRTAIVFVHGIFSDSRGCWLSSESGSDEATFWPDLIRADPRIGKPAIYLAGFHTSLEAGDFSIAQCAREVALTPKSCSTRCPEITLWSRMGLSSSIRTIATSSVACSSRNTTTSFPMAIPRCSRSCNGRIPARFD